MKRILIGIIAIALILVGTQFVYADNIVIEEPGEGRIDEDLKKNLGVTWTNVGVVVQVLAISCVVFAGVRYMFASADQKADIKTGMINLTIGAILVFVTVPVIRLVTYATTRIIDPTLPPEHAEVELPSSPGWSREEVLQRANVMYGYQALKLLSENVDSWWSDGIIIDDDEDIEEILAELIASKTELEVPTAGKSSQLENEGLLAKLYNEYGQDFTNFVKNLFQKMSGSK